MGRSVAQFFLPGRTAESVMQTAWAFATAEGLRICERSANHLTMDRGSKTWTARRVIRIGSWDVPGGANVLVEAWFETILVSEMNANPNDFVGMLPKRQTWSLASSLVLRLGVPPEAVFRHL